MKEEKTHFYSNGHKLDASFYFSEKEEVKDKPLVIVCSGFQGLKNIHPERFARAMTSHGYSCLGFDYRGFGSSEGEPGYVNLEEQVEDIINAAAFASLNSSVNNGVVLVGWGMAGGLILEAAPAVEDLRTLIAINGFYNAVRVQKEVRGNEGWREFKKYITEKRKTAVVNKEVEKIDPFVIYPLDKVSKGYVDNVLRKNEDFGVYVSLSFADSLLRFNPEANLETLGNIPILIAHGENNKLHPVSEAESLYKKYKGEKELYLISDAGHTEWMFDDNEKFKGLIKEINNWIEAYETIRVAR